MHGNCKKRSFAPYNSGVSCLMRTKIPRGTQPCEQERKRTYGIHIRFPDVLFSWKNPQNPFTEGWKRIW